MKSRWPISAARLQRPIALGKAAERRLRVAGFHPTPGRTLPAAAAEPITITRASISAVTAT